MIAKLILSLFMTMSISVLSLQQIPKLKSIEWLLGTWENTNSRGITYETWKKHSDNEFQGRSYKINANDTLVLETISIVEKDNELYYIPTVKDQNSGEPVTFSLIYLSDTEMSFENPEHDFPQAIRYTKINKDSLVAEISGIRDSTSRGIRFPMKKVR